MPLFCWGVTLLLAASFNLIHSPIFYYHFSDTQGHGGKCSLPQSLYIARGTVDNLLIYSKSRWHQYNHSHSQFSPQIIWVPNWAHWAESRSTRRELLAPLQQGSTLLTVSPGYSTQRGVTCFHLGWWGFQEDVWAEYPQLFPFCPFSAF